MNQNYVSFYKNGCRVGTFGLRCNLYYPCLHFENYDAVVSVSASCTEIIECVNSLSIPTLDRFYIPTELKCKVDINFHRITWDPRQCTTELELATENHLVKKTASPDG
jgi:hypothetical protein